MQRRVLVLSVNLVGRTSISRAVTGALATGNESIRPQSVYDEIDYGLQEYGLTEIHVYRRVRVYNGI